MAQSVLTRRTFLAVPPAAALLAASPLRAEGSKYFPAKGNWARKSAADVGMDAVKLKEAIAYAQSSESDWTFDQQVESFGPPLGPVPKTRAATNGIVVRHGYVVAEFGDTKAIDPVYSMAKSLMSTVGGIAVTKGLIKDVNEPVAKYVKDGGYDSPHNAKVTWLHHLTQTSEWEGELFDRNANFLGQEKFGNAAMKPRAIQEPGTYYEYNDVRMCRFGLSLARVFGRGVPEVFKESVMDPIGASDTWKWVGYENSTVDINGKKIQSVPGGTRWGGGFFTGAEDVARVGLLVLNQGNWNGRQLLNRQFLADAVKPTPHGPDYGYCWWLNTAGRSRPNAPRTSFEARGNGGNLIWIDPEHDLVVAWKWGEDMDGFAKRLIAAIKA